MLRKSLYLYAMMVFSFTALQGAEELPKDLEGRTIAKGKCPRCPRHHTSSSDETSFVVVVEDDNDNLDNETGNLFSVVVEDENNPNSSKNALACRGKKRIKPTSSNDALACGCGKKNRKHRRNRAEKSLVSEGHKIKDNLLVCNDEDEETVTILPVLV